MANLKIVDFSSGKEISEFPLSDDIINYSSNRGRKNSVDFLSNFLYRTKKLRFKKTASSKGISDIMGTTKKPLAQKGTGNARQGSKRSPQFRGGAVIFGPIPVTANYKINKKEIILARKILISELLLKNKLTIIENTQEFNKTKEFAKCYSNFVHDVSKEKALIVTKGNKASSSFYNAGKNIKNLSFDLDAHFNIARVLVHSRILITRDALEHLIRIF